MERKEGKDDEGPFVNWYKPVPTVDEGVAPPVLGKVNVPNELRAVERPLDGDLGIAGSLLEYVLHGFFGRLEVGIQFGGSDLVQHLVEQKERCYRGVGGVYLGGREVGMEGTEVID